MKRAETSLIIYQSIRHYQLWLLSVSRLHVSPSQNALIFMSNSVKMSVQETQNISVEEAACVMLTAVAESLTLNLLAPTTVGARINP